MHAVRLSARDERDLAVPAHLADRHYRRQRRDRCGKVGVHPTKRTGYRAEGSSCYG